MPQGDKSAYTDKQKRKAEHIEESYEARGTPKKTAEARAYNYNPLILCIWNVW